MIDSQEEDQFDETGARPRDLEEHDEIITSTTTDGDEFDDDEDEEVIAAGTTDGDGRDVDDDEEVITTGTTTDGDEFNDAEGEEDQEEEPPRRRNFQEIHNSVLTAESVLRELDDEDMITRLRASYRNSGFSITYPPPPEEQGRGVRGGGIGVLPLLDHSSPTQIKAFLHSLPRINMDNSAGTFGPSDNIMCAICQSEFGKEREDAEREGAATTGQGQGQGLEGLGMAGEEESAEYPVKMPCGHVFGLCCIEKWLLINEEPASCPLCRYLFHQAQPSPASFE